MKKVLLGILVIFIVWVGYMYINLKPKKGPLSPKITFLQSQPLIDGILDENLRDHLQKRKYDFRFNLNFFKGSAGSNYRLAYGTDFIYLYLEAKADSFICRDRGYQNGDGFILTISNRIPGKNKTDEHYVMGFSSQYEPDQEWAKKILWNYNGNVMLYRLPEDVLFEFQAKDGRIGFEVVIPWPIIYPYHPFLSADIGFNLWFVKAHPGKRFPNVQGVAFEFPSETGARRYRQVVFEQPKIDQGCQSYLILDKNHCFHGDNIQFNATVLSAQPLKEKLQVVVFDESKELVAKTVFTIDTEAGISNKRFIFGAHEISPGNYSIEWLGTVSNSSGKLDLTVFPEFDYTTIVERLEKLKTNIKEGSYTTFRFYIEEIDRKLNRLKDYENYPEGSTDITDLLDYLKFMESGKDTISVQTGIFRRAFCSELDSTLRPYKIKIPENYNKSEKYPLLVFLHGSGRTDEDMFDKYHRYLSQNNLIQIAPNARGVSHYYGTPEAQFDIKEAIQDAIQNYSVDTTNIVLTGFSMGGYGVYRTYFENPGLFKGLAIFSGMPKVGLLRRSGKGEYPNFLKKKNYEKLTGVPIFIYHGKNDLNCPFELTRKFVDKLLDSDASVQMAFNEGTGHSSPDKTEILIQYYSWLNRLIASNE